MIRFCAACLVLAVTPLHAAEEAELDPQSVDEERAIACDLTAPEYMGFALSVSGEDGIAATRGWAKVEGENPFLAEYDLPEPIRVKGHDTRRIAFSGSAIMAVLDVADPAVLAQREGIVNSLSSGPLGDALLSDVTTPPEADSAWRQRMTVTRTISNVTTHPGKTLYGCSYRTELLDQQGNPL